MRAIDRQQRVQATDETVPSTSAAAAVTVMPSTSKGSSNLNFIEINNNNIGPMLQLYNANNSSKTNNNNDNYYGNNHSNFVDGTTSSSAVVVPSPAPTTTVTAASAFTSGGATAFTSGSTTANALPPMVSISKAALQDDKSAVAAVAIDVVTTAAAATTTAAATGTSTSECATTSRAGRVTSNGSTTIDQRRQSQAANVRLITLVRRRPWLYDQSNARYAKKRCIEKTWSEIGKIFGEPGAVCKERWRNIRAAFARSINIYKTQIGPNRLKPYYLHRELQFLINPMTRRGRKSRMKLEDLSAEECDDISDDEIEDEPDLEDDNVDLVLENMKREQDQNEDCDMMANGNQENSDSAIGNDDELMANNTASVAGNSNSNNNAMHEEIRATGVENGTGGGAGTSTSMGIDPPDDVAIEDLTNLSYSESIPERNRIFDYDELSRPIARLRRQACFEDISDDSEKLFVKSLYYDMSKLDAVQKIRFKKRIYELLEQVSIPIESSSITLSSSSSTDAAATATVAATALVSSGQQTTVSIPPKKSLTPLTAAHKITLQLVRNLDETKINTLNQYITHVLAPPTPSPPPPSQPQNTIEIVDSAVGMGMGNRVSAVNANTSTDTASSNVNGLDAAIIKQECFDELFADI